ncbi:MULTISPECIES: diaminobutyrate acetyltransferase [unclassified Neptuniibacter]|jgi:L-2,4-diaminobutyric acid acetyltransferase|uniref:diaminobutyrate acetyltransferase n=1 Tax=unclassified Neptuniibacter TaxID=2630693 RepID=UPI0026E21110|nr:MULTISPECIES: diaminobutyrate acetyltransferase [unclassified Neptuniibacter]MDO6514122.1 diaminobutyrate acetyltransferase [Neptuniibacter sp. 2_MG-2023]MDO6594041.1 diaminobutyrate acetyltransferase [Neptuniibacter sp. 1_MG-2023]
MDNITYRKPQIADGQDVHQLIKRCPPLDQNSLYCNLIQCRDFSNTSIIAETSSNKIVGFISGYIPQNRPETLFIWQVALDKEFRGKGIAQKMLAQLFSRDPGIRYLETTISPSNSASKQLFERFFNDHLMDVDSKTLFKSGVHLDKDHEDEVLYLAGPAKSFDPRTA